MKTKFVIFFILIKTTVFSQIYVEVDGLVTDSKNNPIPYAHLYLNGSKIGTVTNQEGRFHLNIPSKLCNKELIVSHMGHNPLSYQLECQNKSTIEIRLTESTIQLDEVSVTALSETQIVTRAISNLERNFKVDSVNYTIFSRLTEKIGSNPVLLEESVYALYHGFSTKPEFNILKVRGKGFNKLGEKRYQEARLIGIHSTESHLMLRYTPDFLKKRKIKKYNYKLTKEITYGENTFYVISINSENYLKGGEIWVHKENFGIAYLKQIYRDEYWNNMSKLNTVYESHYKQEGDKWYFTHGIKNNTWHLKKEKVMIESSRLTVTANRTNKRQFKKSDEMGRMSKMLKEFEGSLYEEFWDDYNYIPLDSAFKSSLTNAKNP